ncbi:MAG: DUF1552 domain-containing protein [Deltaproteobacteria bacterium]|nr:DUF1552 domain-containing protein [Deltaproteobacteria bacterium]
MGRRRIGRRRFLRGIGGTTLALPFLEIFAPHTARAGSIANRYSFMFAGFSIGSYGNDQIANAPAGPWNGQVTRALLPLLDYGVDDVVSLVSGLEIPVGTDIPAAGRPANFHSTSHQVLATGQRFDPFNYGQLPGPSSDWVAASVLAQDTPQPVLTYRAQPSFYRVDFDGGTDGTISARINDEGQLEQVPPITSPRLAFESLFEGFVPPDPAEALEATRMLEMRKSVVDLVSEDAQSLLSRLGREDEIRMQRHFDELRALESRLDELELPDAPACQMLRHPGDDPPIGDGIDPSGGADYNSYYENANGYSDEELRATVMTDLIHMAFTCDISRVSSFMLTFAQCFMNMYTLLDLPSDLHEITHGSIGSGEADMQDALADCAAWHVKHFARLVDKLRDTEDFDGTSMLDNTGLVLAFEGGWGFDLESGGNSSPHSTENMVMLVGGRAGGLHASPGGHVPAQGSHPAAVLNTVLSAVGVDETLGEVPDLVDGLIG